MTKTGNSVSPDKLGKAGQVDSQENSLRPARRRAKAASEPQAPTPPVEVKKERSAKRSAPAPVPDEVRKKFVQIKNAYFFADGARAFTDRGDRLTTPSENTEVIRSLIAIAQTRGWGEVVRGWCHRIAASGPAGRLPRSARGAGHEPTEEVGCG